MKSVQPTVKTFRYIKIFSQYYHQWFRDCHDSVVYCMKHGMTQDAERYMRDARRYFDIIINNWDAIEYFTENPDKAYQYDSALPVEFRGL